MTISPADMGWMAAVMDLRGHVYIKDNKDRKNTTRQIVLMAEHKNPAVIRRLSQFTGTKSESMAAKPLKEFMRRSCNEHCPEAHIHVNDDRTMPPITRWTITGAGLAIVADNLLPFMVDDKGLPELVEEILGNLDLQGRGSGAIMATVRRLVGLGWPLPETLVFALQQIQDRLLSFAPKELTGDIE